jgi:hypothetical protein
MSQGVSAAEVAEALDIDEAVVAGFYEQAANPVDVIDAQAQAAANITPGDYAGMSESEIAQMMGYRGGGQTRRFMTGMGPVELAAGGLADAPVNPQMMQEIPPEMVAVEETAVVQEMPEVDYNDLVTMTVEAIRGNIEDADSVINLFIDEYGIEKFRQLRDAVLQSIVPDAQTEGMIAGSSGGMADEVMGMIGEDQQVAVSPGEYIVAADVVSGLGDGNSDAGADVLDQVMDNVRLARSGGRQPAPLDLSKVMPA